VTAYRLSTEVAWNEFYALALPEIDDQHKLLFQMINDLWQGILAKAEVPVTAEVLQRLENYTRTHFSAEEELMRSIAFPRIEEHRRAHRLFIDQISNTRRKWANGEPIGLEILHFLNNWLIDHILTTDKDYAAHYDRSGQPLSRLSEFFPSE
jgi:hemerythrin